MEDHWAYPEGIHDDVPYDAYRAAHGVSKSDLDDLHPVPAEFIEIRSKPKEKPSHDMDLGRLLHFAILEPYRLPEECHVAVDLLNFASKEGKAWKKAHSDGLPIVRASEYSMIEKMAARVREHPRIGPMLERGKVEQSCFCLHSRTGVMRKCRADCLTYENGVPTILDFKSSARIERFEKEVDWRYHVQQAYYQDLLQDVMLVSQVRFRFVVISKKPPYHIRIVTFKPASLEFARECYEDDLDTYRRCKESGVWPGYPDEIEDVSLPAYAFPYEYQRKYD